jgi:protein arginine kinase activator
VHLTKVVLNEEKEMHLCARCAEAKQLVNKQGAKQELNLPAILQTLFGQHLGPQSDELARLACPECGLGYMEFRAQGRLGCPHDYEVFRTGLAPLLQRIHRSTRHAGKSPRRGEPLPGDEGLRELRRRLQQAIQAEAYEEAARLRDLLRKKEEPDAP